jgi:hypothetical protein
MPSTLEHSAASACGPHDIADRLSAIADVTSVVFASVVPMVGGTPDWDVIFIEGRQYASQEIPPMRFFKQVSPQYLATRARGSWPAAISLGPTSTIGAAWCGAPSGRRTAACRWPTSGR